MTGVNDEQLLVRQWRELLALHAYTVGSLDRELQRFGLGASDFEVLDVLVQSDSGDDRGLYVHELADLVHLSQSAVSRLVARLTRDALVTRKECSTDRRRVRVILTNAGRERHGEARPVQLAILRQKLGEAASTTPAGH
ncbi:MarR family transcriptional regulator [Streptomyces sp. NPDC050619]|uniref:MarR family winged helix-turn-helix transcriptional regulator n=1 Tax=Streptomyces sp. NPDC050619 TaxID=3157214 RepID=UPI0034268A83